MNKKQKLAAAGLLCAFIAGCGGGGNSQNQTPPPQSQYTYTQPFDTSINIADSQSGQILGSAGYNGNSSVLENNSNFWTLVQWGNINNLIPMNYSSPGAWQITNPWSHIKFYPQLGNITNIYELATTNVPCASSGTATTENNEFDLFLQPTQLNASTFYISDMGQLELSIGLNFIYQNIQSLCPVDHSGMMTGLILNNADQSIFIQIDLGELLLR